MAHGLVLRMKEMLEHGKQNEMLPDVQNPSYMSNDASKFSDEVNIIKGWLGAINDPKNSKMEYFTLLRQTLLFIFSTKWQKSTKKQDLLYVFKAHYKKFSTITSNCTEIYNAVSRVALHPWNNSILPWQKLFNRTITIDGEEAQAYFASEPEEIVLARVHSLVIQKQVDAAMYLAKMSFMYHSRVARSTGCTGHIHQRRGSVEETSKKGHSSIDWFIFILQRTKSLPLIVSEVQDLRCHEGIEIIFRLRRDPKGKKFSHTLLQIFLMKELVQPSEYCCTKKLFLLFGLMHREIGSSAKEVIESARKIFANHAPSSAHLYLFVDVMWKQFGTNCLDLYVELYVRGLTADINLLEAKKTSEASADVSYIENHLAVVFERLSTLFSDFHEAARECMFSSFSLRPTKERLYALQSLTHHLLSGNVKKQEKPTFVGSYELIPKNCDCGLRCGGPCRATLNKSSFFHPLLNKGISNVSYNVIKDFVSVLESCRYISFQYNLFDWECKFSELDDYLEYFNEDKIALKDWGSDTEVASDASNKSDPEDMDTAFDKNSSNPILAQSVQSSIKRKNNSGNTNETCALDVAANIEVESNVGSNKKIKVQTSSNAVAKVSEASKQCSSSTLPSVIETFIRATLTDKIPKGQAAVYTLPAKFRNPANNETRSLNFSEVSRQSPVGHAVHPYSLTTHGKKENLSSSPQQFSRRNDTATIQSSVESQNNFMTNYGNNVQPVTSAAAALQHGFGRQSVVVTPNSNTSIKRTDPYQQMSYSMQRPSVKTVNPIYKPVVKEMCHSKGNINGEVSLNLSNSSSFEKNKHLHKFHSQTSQFVSSQPPPKSVPKHKPAISTPSHSKNSNIATPFDSSQKVSYDRNSVIQHTMQHVREKPVQIPNQLTVTVKSSTMQQLRNTSQKEMSNLPFFHVNVKDKLISKEHLPVQGTFVISRKPSHMATAPTSTHSITSNVSSLDTHETITVPGILASRSIYQLPLGEHLSKNHEKLQYTKIANTTVTSTVKKIYCKPYAKQLPGNSMRPVESSRNTSCENEVAIHVSKLQSANQNFSDSNSQWKAASNVVNYSNNQNLQWQTDKAVTSSNSQQWKVINSTTVNNHQLKVSAASANNQQWKNNSTVTASNQQWENNRAVTANNQQWSGTNRALSSASSEFLNYQQTSNSCNRSSTSDSQPWYSTPFPKTSTLSSIPSYISDTNARPAIANNKAESHSGINPCNYSKNDNLESKISSCSLLKSRLSAAHSFPSDATTGLNSQFNHNISTYAKSVDKIYGTSQKQFSSERFKKMLSNSSCTKPSPVIDTNSNADSHFHSEKPLNQLQKQYDSGLYDHSVISRDERGVVVFRAPNAVLPSQYSQTPSNNSFTQACCSPLEVNPCQSCSSTIYETKQLDNGKGEREYKFPKEGDPFNQVTENALFDPPNFQSTDTTNKPSGESFSEPSEDIQVSCLICSYTFPKSLLKIHLETAHRDKQLSSKKHEVKKQGSTKNSSINLSSPSGLYASSLALQDPEQTTSGNNSRSFGSSNSDEKKSLIPIAASQGKLINDCLDFIDKNESSLKYSTESSCHEETENLPQIKFLDTTSYVSSSKSVIEFVKEVANAKDLLSNQSNNETTRVQKPNPKIFTIKHKELEISWSENPFSSQQKACTESLMKDLDGRDEQNFVGDTKKFNMRRDFVTSDFKDLNSIKIAHKITTPCSENYQNTHSSKAQNSFVFCSICNKKLHSEINLQMHIKLHHTKLVEEEPVHSRIELDATSPLRGMEVSEPKGKLEELTLSNMLLSSENSPIQPSQVFEFDSFVIDDSDKKAYQPIQKRRPKLNSEAETSQTGGNDLKSKKTLKASTRPCQYCGKILTVTYMRTHILKKHSGRFKVPDNSSFDSTSNQTANSSSYENKNLVFPTVSTLLQEDIDTRTCLSPSDALNTGARFDIAAHEQMFPSDSSVRTGSGSRKFPSQAKESEGKNRLPKCNSKLKTIDKSSKLTIEGTEKYVDSTLECGKNVDFQSEFTESYRCHICFRKYTLQSYLVKHMKSYHRLHNFSEMVCDSQSASSKSSAKSSSSEAKLDSKTLESEPDSEEMRTISEDRSDLIPDEFSEKFSSSEQNVFKFYKENCYEEIPNFDSSSIDQAISTSYNNNLNSDSTHQIVEPEIRSDSHMNSSEMFKLLLSTENIKQTTSSGKGKKVPKIHSCSLCPKSFSYEKNLTKHIKNCQSSTSSLGKLQYNDYTSETSNRPVTDICYNEDNSKEMKLLEMGSNLTSVEQHEMLPITYKNDTFSSKNSDDRIRNSASSSCSQNDSFEFSEENVDHITPPNESNSHNSILYAEMFKDSIDVNSPFLTSSSYDENSVQPKMRKITQSIYIEQSVNIETSSVSTESNECPVCFKKLSTQNHLKQHMEKLHPTSASQENTLADSKTIESGETGLECTLKQEGNIFSQFELQNTSPSSKNLEKPPKEKLSLAEMCNLPFSLNLVDEGIQNSVTVEKLMNSSAKNMLTTENEVINEHELLFADLCNVNRNLASGIEQVKSINILQQDSLPISNLVCTKQQYPAVPSCTTDFLGDKLITENQFPCATMQEKELGNLDEALLSLSNRQNHLEQPTQKCDVFGINPTILTDDSDSALKHALNFSELLEDFEKMTGSSLGSKDVLESNDKCKESTLRTTIEPEKNYKGFYAVVDEKSSSVPNKDIDSVNSLGKLPTQHILNNFLGKYDCKFPKQVNFDDQPDNCILSEKDRCSVTIRHESVLSDKAFAHGRPDSREPDPGKCIPTSYNSLNLAVSIQAISPDKTSSVEVLETPEKIILNSFNANEQCDKVITEKVDQLRDMEELFGNEVLDEQISLLLNASSESNASSLMNITQSTNAETKNFLSKMENKLPLVNTNLKAKSVSTHITDKKSLSNETSNSNNHLTVCESDVHKKNALLNKGHICGICSKALSSLCGLKKHIKRLHPTVADLKVAISNKSAVKSSVASKKKNIPMYVQVKTQNTSNENPSNVTKQIKPINAYQDNQSSVECVPPKEQIGNDYCDNLNDSLQSQEKSTPNMLPELENDKSEEFTKNIVKADLGMLISVLSDPKPSSTAAKQCHLCLKNYSTRSNLKKHILTVHGKTDSSSKDTCQESLPETVSSALQPELKELEYQTTLLSLPDKNLLTRCKTNEHNASQKNIAVQELVEEARKLDDNLSDIRDINISKHDFADAALNTSKNSLNLDVNKTDLNSSPNDSVEVMLELSSKELLFAGSSSDLNKSPEPVLVEKKCSTNSAMKDCALGVINTLSLSSSDNFDGFSKDKIQIISDDTLFPVLNITEFDYEKREMSESEIKSDSRIDMRPGDALDSYLAGSVGLSSSSLNDPLSDSVANLQCESKISENSFLGIQFPLKKDVDACADTPVPTCSSENVFKELNTEYDDVAIKIVEKENELRCPFTVKFNAVSSHSLDMDSQKHLSTKESNNNTDLGSDSPIEISSTEKEQHKEVSNNDDLVVLDSNYPIEKSSNGNEQHKGVSDNHDLISLSGNLPINRSSIRMGQHNEICNTNNVVPLSGNSLIEKSSDSLCSKRFSKNSKECRFCHKVFRSMVMLSQHLKLIHSVPVLKKQRSFSRLKSVEVNIDKLPPPNLSLNSSYDSDSASTLTDISPSKSFEMRNSECDLSRSEGAIENNCSPLNESEVNHDDTIESSGSYVNGLESIKMEKLNQESTKMLLETKNDLSAKIFEKDTIHFPLSNSNSSDKTRIDNNENVVKRRSRRGSCEVIFVSQRREKTVKRRSPFKSREVICLSDNSQNAVKRKNRHTSNKKFKMNSIASNKKFSYTKKTPSRSSKSLSSNNSSTLPKCIIKVCKDETNSVFYQIDNSQKTASPKELSQSSLSDLEDKEVNYKQPTIKSDIDNGRKIGKKPSFKCRKGKRTVQSAYIRPQSIRRAAFLCRLSKFKNATSKSKTRISKFSEKISPTQNHLVINSRDTFSPAESSPKKTKQDISYHDETYKNPGEIGQFLLEHKQPVVCLQRLKDNFVNYSSKPMEDTTSQSTIQLHKINAKKPVVRLERINISNNLTSNIITIHQNNVIINPVPATDQQNSNTVHASNHYHPNQSSQIAGKPMDSMLNNNSLGTLPMQESINVSITLCKLSTAVVLNADSLETNLCSQDTNSLNELESCVSSSPIKKCSVLLNRLPM